MRICSPSLGHLSCLLIWSLVAGIRSRNLSIVVLERRLTSLTVLIGIGLLGLRPVERGEVISFCNVDRYILF